MVRHKNRWLLVKVELADEIRTNEKKKSSSSNGFPSKKEFHGRLRKTISWCFGIAGEVPACDTQVRFCDAETQIAIVRVPRQYCGKIRAALTLLLTRKQLASIGELSEMESKQQDYLASVVSVHGSARTAKIAIFRKFREIYKAKIEESRKLFPEDDKASKRLCKALQERLALIQNTLN